jgi:aminomethyltransferase
MNLLLGMDAVYSMKTPLYEEHLKLGARMTTFAEWEMPLQYSSIVDEVRAVRTAAGIFDLSHMGELIIKGAEATSFLQLMTTNDVSSLRIGDAQYTLLCNEKGGILDDLILYRQDSDRYMLVTNAVNRNSDFNWLKNWLRERLTMSVTISDESANISLIAVQGPCSAYLLEGITNLDIHKLRRYTACQGYVGNVSCWIARTGYTGEDGFELFCSTTEVINLWHTLVQQGTHYGALPAGIGARDVLRIEAGYPLYDHELNSSITPVEARLLRPVKWSKPSFIGKEAILARHREGPQKILVGLEALERCVPRESYKVISEGSIVGNVTSGTFSPTLGRGIALAYVEPAHSANDTLLHVEIRNKLCLCRTVPLPFYRKSQPN